MAHKKPITVVVDGINITASHFAEMSREDAIKAMKKDNIGEGKLLDDFFGKAYDASVEAMEKENKKSEKVETANQKEAVNTMLAANKAGGQINP